MQTEVWSLTSRKDGKGKEQRSGNVQRIAKWGVPARDIPSSFLTTYFEFYRCHHWITSWITQCINRYSIDTVRYVSEKGTKYQYEV